MCIRDRSVGYLNFNQAASYAISGSQTLTLDNSGFGAQVAVTAGSANVLAPPISLNDTASISVGAGDALTLNGVCLLYTSCPASRTGAPRRRARVSVSLMPRPAAATWRP